ncbi:hypothetical protein QUA90_28485 [Microcoleus sp. D3_18_C4]
MLRITVAVEPTLEGNAHNRSRKFQQLLCPFYSLGDRVLIRSRADRLLKQISEKSVKVICFQPTLGKENGWLCG